jgi:endo-beta-N-acetylglucosaminidase D
VKDEAVAFCKSKKAEDWYGLAKWLKDHSFMTGKERSQCFNMGRAVDSPYKEPSEVLSFACQRIWKDAVENYGWMPEQDEH